MQVGDKQPRSFAVNDNVMVRDLRPCATDKWRKGIIAKVLGPPNYEVTVDGHPRQAHVAWYQQQADQDHDEDDIATSIDNTVVPLVPLEVESNSLNDS